jgi:AcrR family transcriptional regulator
MTESTRPSSSRPRRHVAGATAHEHLLEAASELFYRQGVRAVGVEAVVERAGVNKMSLYRQFESKDELVLAYLQQMDGFFRQRFEASVAKHPHEPRRQLRQVLADLVARASTPHYRGCPFVNVAAEFADAEHPARQCVADNKRWLLGRLRELCAAAGAVDPGALADALALLMEGAYTGTQTYGPASGPLLAAPRVADQLITLACAASRTESAAD